MRPRTTLAFLALCCSVGCVCVACVFVGCGPRTPATYPVTGKVTFAGGQPVTAGVIEFNSVEHKVSARGRIASDGSFRLSTYGDGDGAIAGKHLVTIAQPIVADRPLVQLHHHPGPVSRVHPRYADPSTSGLEFVVQTRGPNEFQIELGP